MSTKSPSRRRKPVRQRASQSIRRPRTSVQKRRDMLLVALDIEQKDIAAEMGESKQIVSNIFRDRHRSVDLEEKVLGYLQAKVDQTENPVTLGLVQGVLPNRKVTRSFMGWPMPGDSPE